MKETRIFLSVEQTVSKTLPRFVIDSCDQITITHLPNQSLVDTVDKVKQINDYAGAPKAVPHIAARNLTNEQELLDSCQAFCDEGVNTVLIIGGDNKQGKCFSSAFQICRHINIFNFNKLCGVYPQIETADHVKKKKYRSFSEGITQFCLKPQLLNRFRENTRIGVPSQCSLSKLIKFAKRCGVLNSLKHCADNLEGICYLDVNGFNTRKFVSHINNQRFHVYNFGKIEKTIHNLLELQ